MKMLVPFACQFCGHVSDRLKAELSGSHVRLRCRKCRQTLLLDHRASTLALAKQSADRIERWGSTDLLDRAFTGFAALPAGRSCWDVLGIPPGSPPEKVDAAYRALAKSLHPDAGGSDDEMAALNRAREEAKR